MHTNRLEFLTNTLLRSERKGHGLGDLGLIIRTRQDRLQATFHCWFILLSFGYLLQFL